MKTDNYEEIYQMALEVINENEFTIKEYISNHNLALWAMQVYNMYSENKVITTRLQKLIDISVIISHTKISVIINDTSKSSYTKAEKIIQYEDLETDLLMLLILLDFTYIKAES